MCASRTQLVTKSKHINTRIDRCLLEKIDTLHSGAFSRGAVVNMLLETAVQQWEEWLTQTGEIEVCAEHRCAEYHPIWNGYKNTFPYTKEKMENDAERLRRFEESIE